MTNAKKYKTAKERAAAIQKYCAQHHDCDGCPFVDLMGDHCSVCQFYWLDLEAPEEKPLPCPFCGGETRCAKEWNGLFRVVCTKTDCWYSANTHAAEESAIAAHNRVARAAKTNLQ